ncbi:unnamed protein product [Ilex paraguariensis]|uniref:Uncharacterized protein n=1 Tax=Ilex paraguariensis TaxID=185542 RepID=A0ABC8QVP6_9AQUA
MVLYSTGTWVSEMSRMSLVLEYPHPDWIGAETNQDMDNALRTACNVIVPPHKSSPWLSMYVGRSWRSARPHKNYRKFVSSDPPDS